MCLARNLEAHQSANFISTFNLEAHQSANFVLTFTAVKIYSPITKGDARFVNHLPALNQNGTDPSNLKI